MPKTKNAFDDFQEIKVREWNLVALESFRDRETARPQRRDGDDDTDPD